MYVGTIIEYDDQSAITTLPIADVRTQPLYLSLFTSDKGPEEWTVMSGEDWFKAYGDSVSFAKHGQPLLQAAISINAGARLLSKRLVASDATLANLSIVATITEGTVQSTDKDGRPLYTDEDGQITTDVTENPVMIKTATIKYEGKSVESITDNDIQSVFDAVKTDVTGENSFLLFTIADNGRGVSNKRFMITFNYRLSKSKSYIEYTLNVTENNNSLEDLNFSAVPHLVVNGSNHSLGSVIKTKSTQLRCIQNDDGLNAMIAKLAEITGVDVTDIEASDFLFGYTNKGVPSTNILINAEGLNLQNSFGQALLEGSNGIFADSPLSETAVDEYVNQAEYALGTDSNNVFDTAIYDLDRYKIDLIIDANYPDGVKRAIETLVTFREDCAFLRDMGTEVNSLSAIQIYNEELVVKNKFISTYATSYDIIDPYSKKQIRVSIGYSLAKLMVSHLNAGRILPVCGIKHNMIITDAIPGTLNFAPVVCPEPLGNQKEVMEDLRVNYATYIGSDLVIETEYTSQPEYTQFSFLNNVLGVQEVVRAIRTRCPVIRYSFINGEDLERYKSDIEDVIARYTSNFKSISFSYVADPTYTNNKIFYAAIKVGFRDFIQTEWFKVTAINVSETAQ